MSKSAWLIDDLDEQRAPKLRPYLVWTQQSGASHVWWIVSDPIANRHFRCEEFEARFLRLLDGHSALPKIVQELTKEFSTSAAKLSKVQAILKFAESNQLLVPRNTEFARLPKPTRVEPTRRHVSYLIHGLQQTLMSVVFQRIPLGDPQKFARYWAARTDWLFSADAVSAWTGFMLTSWIALLFAIFRIDHVAWDGALSLETISDWRLWLGGVILFIATRILHEAAHAVVCVRQGARCHQVGLMRILCIAFPYVDVTDAWRIADRNARMAVFAAGIYVDLIIASAAVWVWQINGPGLIRDLSLMTVAMGITGSLLFNANPLMKYDGYYVLSDWLEVADLQRSSREWYRSWLFRCLHPNENREDSASSRSGWLRIFLALYAPISKVYRLSMAFGILVALLLTFHAWHMTELGWSLSGLSLVLGMAATVDNRLWAARSDAFPTTAPVGHGCMRIVLFSVARYAIWISAVVCLAGLTLVPLPERIHASGITASRGRQPLYVAASNTTLQSVSLDPSLELQFSRDAADAELTQIRQSIEEIDSKIAALKKEAYHDPGLFGRLPQLNTIRDLRKRRHAFLSGQSSTFHISVGQNQRFVPVPVVTAKSRPSSLIHGVTAFEKLTPHKTILQPSMLGARLERGTLIGYACEADRIAVVEVMLTQADRPSVHLGQYARVRLQQYPFQVFRASIVSISQLTQQEQQKSNSPTESISQNTSSHYVVELVLDQRDKNVLFVEDGGAEVVFAVQGKSLLSKFIDYANHLSR